jgi:hypothetical protein
MLWTMPLPSRRVFLGVIVAANYISHVFVVFFRTGELRFKCQAPFCDRFARPSAKQAMFQKSMVGAKVANLPRYMPTKMQLFINFTAAGAWIRNSTNAACARPLIKQIFATPVNLADRCLSVAHDMSGLGSARSVR